MRTFSRHMATLNRPPLMPVKMPHSTDTPTSFSVVRLKRCLHKRNKQQRQRQQKSQAWCQKTKHLPTRAAEPSTSGEAGICVAGHQPVVPNEAGPNGMALLQWHVLRHEHAQAARSMRKEAACNRNPHHSGSDAAQTAKHKAPPKHWLRRHLPMWQSMGCCYCSKAGILELRGSNKSYHQIQANQRLPHLQHPLGTSL